MAYYLSPTVAIREQELTTSVPAVSTNVTVNVGIFNKGPVNTKMLITNKNEQIDIFGEPSSMSYMDVMTNLNFLERGDKLYVTRVVNEDGIQTALQGSHTINTNTLIVASTADYPVSGTLVILHGSGNREVVTYSGKSSVTFNNVIRAYAGSIASSYVGGETVALTPENASLAVANTAIPFVAGSAATGSITFNVTPSVLSHDDTITLSDGTTNIAFGLAKTRPFSDFTSEATTDILTLSTNLGLVTGDVVNLDEDDGLPTGLAEFTNYFVSVLSPTTVKLHLTKANAIAGTSAVNFTSNGGGENRLKLAYAGDLTSTNSIPVDISADSSSVTIDHVGTPFQLMIDDLYVIDVITSVPFIHAPFSSVSGYLGTNTTLADAQTFFPGSVISTASGDKGIVRYIKNNKLYVQVTTGSFELAESVDNDNTYTSAKTQVITSTKLLNITATYSSPTVTLTNNNANTGSELGNTTILVSEANTGSYSIVGMAGAVEPNNGRGDYITRYNNVEDPLTEIGFSDNEILKVYAKNPGVWGSKISISMTNPYEWSNAVLLRQGSQITNFANRTTKLNADRREISFVVMLTDKLGNKSIVEVFSGSLNYNGKTASGLTDFIENTVNNGSAYVNIAVNPISSGLDVTVSNLTVALTNNATTATVTSTEGFPSAGVIKIEQEQMLYTGTTLTTFTGLTRGINGTIATEHATDTEIVEYNTVSTITDKYLLGGADGIVDRSSVTDEVIAGYDLYSDPEEIDVNIIVDGGNVEDITIQQYIIDGIVEKRRDCLAALTVPWRSVNYPKTTQQVSGMIAYRSTPGDASSLNRSTSYAALYGNWKYEYDRYNDILRWVPMAGDIAGIMADVDNRRDPWFAPAGTTYGQIRNAAKLKVQPNQGHRDLLYDSEINPIAELRGYGPIVYGQKTLLNRAAATSSINIRRMLLTIERAIGRFAKDFLFENNNEFTRKVMLSRIEPYLRDVRGRQGLTDFYVQCDSNNNTPTTIERRELHVDIYVKPQYAIEAIQLNFVATPLGASFQELVNTGG